MLLSDGQKSKYNIEKGAQSISYRASVIHLFVMILFVMLLDGR